MPLQARGGRNSLWKRAALASMMLRRSAMTSGVVAVGGAVRPGRTSAGSVQDTGTTLAAVVARLDVLAQYEAATTAAGIHAGLVDLASFNIMNGVMASGLSTTSDWLLVCLAHEGTAIASRRHLDQC
mgnify:CR=1 FL=1